MDMKKELILNESENLNWGLCPISFANANGESEREKERGERERERESVTLPRQRNTPREKPSIKIA